MESQKIKHYEDVLFANRSTFGNFRRNVNKIEFSKIDEKTREFIEKLKRFSHSNGNFDNSATLYENALLFLTSNCGMSFNEKIIFLIHLFDPYLEMHKMYKRYSKEIMRQNEKGYITNISVDDQFELIDSITKRFGFYNPYLLKYEEIYSLYYRNEKIIPGEEKELSINVKVDYVSQFMKNVKSNDVSLDVSSDKLNTIIGLARDYLINYYEAAQKSTVNSSVKKLAPSLNDLIYQLIYEIDCKDIKTLADKIIFIICVMDYGLYYLQCNDTCYSYTQIKNEIIQVYGNYSQDLMYMVEKFGKENKHARELIA